MINDDTHGMAEFCCHDVFGTRIAALYTAYGDAFKGVSFRQQREGGEILASLSICDGAAVLSAGQNADFDELAQYLRFTGFSTLLCEKTVRERLKIRSEKCGFVVRCDESATTFPPNTVTDGHRDFSYRAVYDILGVCGFGVGNYCEWLADISIRCRRGAAKTLAVCENGRFVSTASALYITDTAVLLGAVGTLPKMRGRGYAGKLVCALAHENTSKNRRVELLCETKRLSFYEQNGFYTVGEWTQ